MAGYSGTPLAKKLGVKPHSRLLFLRAPAEFTVPDLPAAVAAHRRPTSGPYDTILLFAADQAQLTKASEAAAKRLTTAGGLWVCWPKKASGVITDLTENEVRNHGLAAGLVDVKVAAIDETWSGLRFVRRLSDR